LNSRVNARRFRFAMRTPIYASPRVSTKSGQFHGLLLLGRVIHECSVCLSMRSHA
jgi:hypothetical protein